MTTVILPTPKMAAWLMKPWTAEDMVSPKCGAARRVLAKASVETGMSIVRLKGMDRSQTVARVRSAICWVMRERLGLSSTIIGGHLHRDHTTVLSALKRAEQYRKTGGDFIALCDRLETAI